MTEEPRSYPRYVIPTILLIALLGPLATIEYLQRQKYAELAKQVDAVIKTIQSGTPFIYEDGKGFRPAVSGDGLLKAPESLSLSYPNEDQWSRRELAWTLDLESRTPEKQPLSLDLRIELTQPRTVVLRAPVLTLIWRQPPHPKFRKFIEEYFAKFEYSTGTTYGTP